MPELPEVETIKRGLSQFIIKDRIRKVHVLCEKSFQGESGKLLGASIISIRRFGKALIIDLDSQKSLMIHLRMTGQLVYDPKNSKGNQNRFAAGHPSENFVENLPNKQTRVIIELEKGTLYFNDQRKFGFIKVLPTKEIKNDPFIKKLAKEPWDMPPDEFYKKIIRHQNSPIKAALLDQTIVAGLGNIYTDETLFAAHIHPATKVKDLTKEDFDIILSMACRVMDFAISSGGSTIKDYVKADGTRGNYLDKFAQVYGREGKPCVCGAKIQKIRVAGRGTHFCPNCQKEPK